MVNSEIKLLYSDKSKVNVCHIEEYFTTKTDNKICKSKREVRELHSAGALSINKQKIEFEHKYIMWITNATWDIPNKALTPYYLLSEYEYEQLKTQKGI